MDCTSAFTPALDVAVHRAILEAGRAKVDELDGTTLQGRQAAANHAANDLAGHQWLTVELYKSGPQQA
eukprot:1159195-Pelagomonas_calceolata.AAC.3